MIRRSTDAAPNRPIAGLTAIAIAGLAALCLPAASAASAPSGGASIGTLPSVTAQPSTLTVSAAGNGMTIAARASASLRAGLQINGTMASADAGRTVEIELMGARTDWSWQTEAQTQVQSDGGYAAAVRPARAGQYAVRAVLGRAGATTAASLPTITVVVYRPAIATLYGPGFYGHRTACGTILRRWTVGVANRTLPCGTRVAVYYGGQMVVVPVIDRGPYANGATWDLTMATGRALSLFTTATIGAASLPTAKTQTQTG